jgi:hypothetical protein
MGTIEMLLIAWGVVTALLICVMIYRSALQTHEEDQIFLDSAGESMAREQREIVSKIEKLGMPITGLAILSGAILVAIVGMWLYQGYKNF